MQEETFSLGYEADDLWNRSGFLGGDDQARKKKKRWIAGLCRLRRMAGRVEMERRGPGGLVCGVPMWGSRLSGPPHRVGGMKKNPPVFAVDASDSKKKKEKKKRKTRPTAPWVLSFHFLLWRPNGWMDGWNRAKSLVRTAHTQPHGAAVSARISLFVSRI